MDIISEIAKIETGTRASEQAIASAERDIGFRFPALLRDLYLKVANGGVGPGYQILGVKGGHASDEGYSVSELYVVFSGADPEDPSWQWPKGIVPFCHWGCAIYSCFDATKENYPVVWFDPNNREFGEPMGLQFIPHKESLESWFKAWLDGADLWAETFGT